MHNLHNPLHKGSNQGHTDFSSNNHPVNNIFQVGETYYGTLAVAHGDFPVTCIKRTAKMVTFEHATLGHCYATKRSKIHDHGEYGESARFHGWYISSTKKSGGDFDTLTI
mgnify:CR=1 FL=1